MLPLTVGEIVRSTNGTLVMGDPQASVGRRDVPEGVLFPGLSIDSRKVNVGDLYIAIKGEKFDGHDFVNESIEKGARAVIVSKFSSHLIPSLSAIRGFVQVRDTKKALADLAKFYRQKYGRRTQVVGVTGSSGKTTVKEMTAQILSLAGLTHSSPGNFNNEVGCPLSVLNLRPEHAFAVFEIGSSAVGEVRKLSDIVKPKVAVVTNILLEHTETFGTIEQIAEGESEILEFLGEEGTAVLPYDDPHYGFLKSKVPSRCKVKSFGFSEKASVHVKGFTAWPEPATFKIMHQSEDGNVLNELDCTLPIIGRINALNAAAAAAVAFTLGVNELHIQNALQRYRPPGMRFQAYHLRDKVTLINDSYNANPGSMRSAIESFIESYPGRKACLVLGDMLELGEISRKEHYDLGKFVAQKSVSKVLLYGPQSKFTYDGAKDSMMHESNLEHCSDFETLIGKTEQLLTSDCVLFFKASRGMHLEKAVQHLLEKHPVVL